MTEAGKEYERGVTDGRREALGDFRKTLIEAVGQNDCQGSIFEEMERRFSYQNSNDKYLPIDDSQLGVEFALMEVRTAIRELIS